MRRIRYMVVDHPVNDSKVRVENGQVFGVLPIHTLLGDYHWARLNDNHVAVVGDYPIGNHAKLNNHEKVSVLPHTASSKKVHSNIKQHHAVSLVNALGVDVDSTTSDVVDALEAKYGTVFSPQR